MEAAEKLFSRQNHAHKQRRQGFSCHRASSCGELSACLPKQAVFYPNPVLCVFDRFFSIQIPFYAFSIESFPSKTPFVPKRIQSVHLSYASGPPLKPEGLGAEVRRHCPSVRSCHSSLSKAVRFEGYRTRRCGQEPSGTLRHAPKRSISTTSQPSSIASTVFNSHKRHKRLKRHKRHKRPKSPNSPKDGCSLSIPVSQSPNFP